MISEVVVAVAPRYKVRIGPGALAGLPEAAAAFHGRALLTDSLVDGLHGARLSALGDTPRLALPPGESSKSLGTLERVLEFLAGCGLDRGSVLITLGGGVIADLGGLAASLFMRGIAVIHCPSTLLAQADAAIGGKTAVNLRAGKNLAGTFHQPRAVFADTALLSTLDDDQLRSGLGEAVKSAVLGAPGLFECLEREAQRILGREPEPLAEVVTACVRLKAGIVAQDERDAGTRKRLNLGHTFGHAIEHAAGYGRVPHGVAVAVGIVLALEAGQALGIPVDGALPKRLRTLLGRLGMPVSLDGLRRERGLELRPEAMVEAMRQDKKGTAGQASLVVPRGLGELELDVRPGEGFLLRLLARG